MTLFQLKDGYRYNCDTIFLWSFIAKYANIRAGFRVLDVGCGCGILGLLLKRDFAQIELFMLDLQKINCQISLLNARENGLNCEIFCGDFSKFGAKFDASKAKNDTNFNVSDGMNLNTKFYVNDCAKISTNIFKNQCKFGKSNLDENLKISRFGFKNLSNSQNLADDFTQNLSQISTKFDLIVSNPPFYRDGALQSTNDHIKLSRYSQNLEIESFLRVANLSLKQNGAIAFCYECSEILRVFMALKENKFSPLKVQFIHPKADKNAKTMLIFAKKNSRGVCEILPPFISNDGHDFTQMAKEIFTKANLTSQNYTEKK